MQLEMIRFETSRLCYQCLLSVEVGGGEVWFSNSTRLRMRSLNCVPEDMPCGWATAHTVVALLLNKRLQLLQKYGNQQLHNLLFDFARWHMLRWLVINFLSK